MPQTKHAAIRAQQRGIPPLVNLWLDEFGEISYDGNGFVRVFFSHKSVRNMERNFGRHPVALMRHYLHAYRLETTDGKPITTGWRTKQIWRK